MKALVISLTASALLALLGAGCVTDIGDQVCTPDSVATDKDDDCPFGAPGGPKPELRPADPNETQCEGITPVTDAAECTKTWATDVFPILQIGPMNCTLGGCHGNEPGSAMFYLPTDPVVAYDELTTYLSQGTGKPYLNPANLAESYILCNLRGDVGAPMPPSSGISETSPEYLLVESWAKCGAPRDGVGGPP